MDPWFAPIAIANRKSHEARSRLEQCRRHGCRVADNNVWCKVASEQTSSALFNMVQASSLLTPDDDKGRILIIGAGITGLVLGQALKKHGSAFIIFERDPDVSARGRGWGLTIHWSLDTFISLLPQHLVDRLPETYVNPEASKQGENGNFLFFDLRSGETRWQVPPNKRIRVSRERLRALLLDGLDVQVFWRVLQFADVLKRKSRLIMTIMSCKLSGPAPSIQFPHPLPIPSRLISPMPLQLQALYLSERTDRGQAFALFYCHTIHDLQSTMGCPCDFWAPASSIPGSLHSRCAP